MNSFRSLKSGLTRLVLLLAIVFFSYSGTAHASVSWIKSYTGALLDRAVVIQPTTDGGYITAGIDGATSGYDILVMKLDVVGNIQWQKTYGGTGSEVANYIQQTSDGGYIVLGTDNFSGHSLILKLAADGNVQWQKYVNVGTTGTSTIQQTSDGGYIFAGANPSYWIGTISVLKLDANGDIQWQNLYVGNGSEEGPSSIWEASDGGYLLAATKHEAGIRKAMIIKLNGDGTVKWQKSIEGSLTSTITSMKPTADGGCIVSGESDDLVQIIYYNWVFKLDANGNIQWQKKMNNDSRSGSLVLPTPDDGFLLGIRGDHFLLAKFDKDGNKQWVRGNFGGGGLESLQNTPDGGFVISTYLGIYAPWIQILKFDSSAAPSSGCGLGNVSDIAVTDLNFVINDTALLPRLNNSSLWDSSLTVTDSVLTTQSFCMSALPAISVTPASLDFSVIKLGNSSAKTVTVSNSGAADLTISGAVITGTNANEFVASNNCTNIAPNGSCSITINFAPVSPGSKTATLSVASNDPVTPNKYVVLSGTGTLPTYAVSTSVIGGNGVISCDTTVNQGVTSNCTISPDTGFHLATFTDNTVDKLTSVIANVYSIANVTADHTIAGSFALDSHSVSFNSNGGSAVNSQSVLYNSAATAPSAPTRTGYTFAGWYNDAGLTTTFAFSTAITADTTLYAKWAINSYTVSFNSNGGSAVDSQGVVYNSTATVPATPTRTGYTFAGWYNDAVLTTAFAFSTAITADTTLYAKWAINSYTVSFNSNGGSVVNSQSVVYNNTATSPAIPTRTGYTFVKWYSNSALTLTFNFTTPITNNITLYAKWTKNDEEDDD